MRYSKQRVEYKLAKEEAFKRIRKADLCILDLDECITPKITSIELIKPMLKMMLFKPKKPRDRVLLFTSFAPKSFWSYISVDLIRRKIFGLSAENSNDLISPYVNIVKDIPTDYFKDAAEEVVKSNYPGSKETLEEIASLCKIGIISYAGLEPVIAKCIENLNKDKEVISFYDCTPIKWREKDGVKVFEDLDRKMLIGKGELAKKRIEEFNSKHPITIGHSKDELDIVEEVKKRGGLSIGFNPEKDIRNYFNVLVYAKNWWPIQELIHEAKKTYATTKQYL